MKMGQMKKMGMGKQMEKEMGKMMDKAKQPAGPMSPKKTSYDNSPKGKSKGRRGY